MSRRRASRVGKLASVAALLVSAAAARGADVEPARALLAQVRWLNETTRAWTDRTQQLDLTIVDRRGNERRRAMKIMTRRPDPDRTRTILFFTSPPQVRGIGLLQWTAPHEEDRQWLYLPELKRVRQITGSSKRESFVGTDFSYEDLSIWSEVLDWTEEDAGAALLRDETVDGEECAVIEMRPTGAGVSYEKIRLWLGRRDSVIHRMEFEGGGKTVKILLLTDVRPVGAIPVAHRLEMQNARSGSSTRVVMREIAYDTGLSGDRFTQRALEKGP
jgi:hypothetical protein